MNARHALVAVIIAAVAASPAGATVLSASNQAVGTKSSKADYLRVTEVQKDLNSTMEQVNGAAVANGPLSASAPATGQAGYILQKEGDGGKSYPDYEPFVDPAMDDGLQGGTLSMPGRGQTPGTYSSDTRRIIQNDRHNGGSGGGSHRKGGNPHAAPEPSTWMLLGLGLAMFGGYATLRRRTALQN